jgi:hypothetical protein
MTNNTLVAVPTTAPTPDTLVVLNLSEIQFLLQAGVESLLPIKDMRPPSDELACGSLEFEGELIPVFCLDHHLQLQAVAGSTCVAVALLSNGSQRFGLVCLGLEKWANPAPVFYRVPVCMTSRKQPFSEFAVIDNKVVGLTSAAELLRVLGLRGAYVARETWQRQELSR